LFFKKRIIKEDVVMAGTKVGGQAAAKTNKTKYGPDFYARIGAQGGKKGHTGGFFTNHELARIAGARGGRVSRRSKKTA
jgi:general stress protein YciG